MNLLAKKRSLRNILKPGLIMLIPVFFGCETSNDLGIQYDLGTDANVKFQEFVLPATNIYIDSLRTDGEGRVLVGSYTDPLTGSISAEGYFQYFYERGPLPRQKSEKDQVYNDTLKLDSLIILFDANAIVPHRGNSFQEFSIHDLQDSLQSSAIYLSGLKQTPTTLAGTYSGSINTLLDTIYRVKLEAAYAQSFFDYLSDIAGDTTKTIASTTFKSLGLIPGAGSQSIASFDLTSDTSRLILYTSPVDPAAKDTTYLTYFRFNGKQYSSLERDKSGSSFDGIVEYEDFDLSDGKTVIDPLAGIKTVVSIADLEDFFDQNRNILINSATISFEFESEIERDTLTRFINFFRKQDGRIFGPATANNAFGNIVMADNGYLSLQSDPAASSLNEDENKLLLTATLFYQQYYREFLDGDSLAYQHPLNGTIIPVDELVTMNTADVILQRSVFKNDGIILRLFYTEVE